MDLNGFNNQFEESMKDMGIDITLYTTVENEYCLRVNREGVTDALVLIKATVYPDSLYIQEPSVYKPGFTGRHILSIYKYFISLAELLQKPKVHLSISIINNKLYKDMTGIGALLGFKWISPVECVFDNSYQMNVFPIVEDMVKSLDTIRKKDPAFRVRIAMQKENESEAIFEMHFLWEGIEDKVSVSYKMDSFYLKHGDSETLLDGNNAFNKLSEIINEISESQKLKNLIDPPVTNLFNLIARTIDKEKKPLKIYESLAKDIMFEFIELGYSYQEVENQAASIINGTSSHGKEIHLINDCFIVPFLNQSLVFLKTGAEQEWEICNDYNDSVEFILNRVKNYLLELK